MPRRIYEPDAITTDIALDAIDLIEAGVTTLADMGIEPIRTYRATCSLHGVFVFDVHNAIPSYLQCPDHWGAGITHMLPCHEATPDEIRRSYAEEKNSAEGY